MAWGALNASLDSLSAESIPDGTTLHAWDCCGLEEQVNAPTCIFISRIEKRDEKWPFPKLCSERRAKVAPRARDELALSAARFSTLASTLALAAVEQATLAPKDPQLASTAVLSAAAALKAAKATFAAAVAMEQERKPSGFFIDRSELVVASQAVAAAAAGEQVRGDLLDDIRAKVERAAAIGLRATLSDAEMAASAGDAAAGSKRLSPPASHDLSWSSAPSSAAAPASSDVAALNFDLVHAAASRLASGPPSGGQEVESDLADSICQELLTHHLGHWTTDKSAPKRTRIDFDQQLKDADMHLLAAWKAGIQVIAAAKSQRQLQWKRRATGDTEVKISSGKASVSDAVDGIAGVLQVICEAQPGPAARLEAASALLDVISIKREIDAIEEWRQEPGGATAFEMPEPHERAGPFLEPIAWPELVPTDVERTAELIRQALAGASALQAGTQFRELQPAEGVPRPLSHPGRRSRPSQQALRAETDQSVLRGTGLQAKVGSNADQPQRLAEQAPAPSAMIPGNSGAQSHDNPSAPCPWSAFSCVDEPLRIE